MVSRILVGPLSVSAFLGIGFFAIFMIQPSEFVVERSVVIDASPQEVFSYGDDFRAWQEWSSWAGPEREPTFSGADRGKGAVWEKKTS